MLSSLSSAVLTALLPHPYGLATGHLLAIAATFALAVLGFVLIVLRAYAKPILTGVAIAGVLAFLSMGAFSIERIYRRVESQAQELAQAQVARDLAARSLEELQRQHDAQIRHLQELEDARAADAIEARTAAAGARKTTRTIQKDFDRDATDAARRLRAHGADLNRLLERESGRHPH